MDREDVAERLLLHELVEAAGPKHVAARLGVSESHLSNMLAGTRPMRWAYRCIIAREFDPESRWATYVNRATGHAKPRRVVAFTDAERAAAYQRVIKRHGLKDIEAEVRDELEAGE